MPIRLTHRNRIPVFARETRAALANVVKETAHKIAGRAAITAPVDEGELQGSIYAEGTSDPLTWKVVVGAGHGADVEFGTGPHEIRPVKGKFLRFKIDGREIFARMVHHPGTAPQPYLRPAVNYEAPRFDARIAAVMRGKK